MILYYLLLAQITTHAVQLRIYDEPYMPYHVLLRFGKASRVELRLAIDTQDTTEIELWGSSHTWYQAGDLRLLDQAVRHPRCPRSNEHGYLMYSTTLKRDLFVCGGGAARQYGVHGSFPIGTRSSLMVLYPRIQLDWLRLHLGECTPEHNSPSFAFGCDVSNTSRAGGLCLAQTTIHQMDNSTRTHQMQLFDESQLAVFDEYTYTMLSRNGTSNKWISVWGQKIFMVYFENEYTFSFNMRSSSSSFSLGHGLLRAHSVCVMRDTGRASLVSTSVNTEIDVYVCVFIVTVMIILFFLNRSPLFVNNEHVAQTIILECVYHGICTSILADHLQSYWALNLLHVTAILSSVLSFTTLLTYWTAKSNFHKLAHQITRDTHCVVTLPFLLNRFSSSITVCLTHVVLMCFGSYNIVFLLSRTLADMVYTGNMQDVVYWLSLLSCSVVCINLYTQWSYAFVATHMYLLDQDTPFSFHGSALVLLVTLSEICTSMSLKKETDGTVVLETNSHVVAKHTLKSMKRASESHSKDAELGQALIDSTRLLERTGVQKVARRRVYPAAMSARKIMKPLN